MAAVSWRMKPTAIHRKGSGTRVAGAAMGSMRARSPRRRDSMAHPMTPQSHGEEVAVFRHSLIGELAVRELDRGERSAQLRRLSEQRVRPPGSDTTRCYSVT